MRAMLSLSVVFLAFTLLFQDNMNAYTMQMNYQSYGQWLIQTTDPVFDDNPYLTLNGIVRSGSRIYLTEARNAGVQVIDEENEEEPETEADNEITPEQLTISAKDATRSTNLFLGAMSPQFALENNIQLYEGRFPETDGEIVMELSALQTLGLGYELGQEVSFYIAEPIEWPEIEPGQPLPEDPPRVLDLMSFTLVGTVEHYTARWNSYGDLPNAILTEHAYSELKMDQRNYRFYSLNENYRTADVWQFAMELFDSIGEANRYKESEYLVNASAFYNPFWGNPTMYRIVTIVLILLSAAIVSYLIATYLGRRRFFFLQLRELGASTLEVWRMAAFECVGSCLPAMLLALIGAYALSFLTVLLVSVVSRLPFFYSFRVETLLWIVVCAALVLLLSLVVGLTRISGGRITEKRKGFSTHTVRRLSRRAKRRERCDRAYLGPQETFVRTRMLHISRTLLLRIAGIACTAVVLYCAAQIYDNAVTCRSLRMEHGDLEGAMPYLYSSRLQVPVKPYKTPTGRLRDFETQSVQGNLPSLRNTIPETFFTYAADLPGVERVERSMDDSLCRLEWDGKADDPFFQSALEEYARLFTYTEHVFDLSSSKADAFLREQEHYLSLVTCFDDADSVWKKYADALDPKYASEEAFHDGSQVIIAVDQSWSTLNAIKYSGELTPQDNVWTRLGASFQAGDRLEITNGTGSVTVTIAAVVDAGNAPSALIQVIGSEQLMQAIAEVEGVDWGWNRFAIHLNALSDRENTVKGLTELCSAYGIQYSSYVEPLREARDALFQAIITYGFFGMILLILWLFVCSAIATEQAEQLRPERRSLRDMGCPAEALRAAQRLDALRQSLVLLASFPLFLAARIIEIHGELGSSGFMGFFSVLLRRFLFYTGTMPTEASLESDPWLIAAFFTLERSKPWLMLLPLAGIVLLYWYFNGKTDKGAIKHE